MIKEPYETTLLHGYPIKKLTEQLEVHFINGELTPILTSEGASSHLLEILPGITGIEQMVAPMVVETRDGPKVVFDARASKRERRGGAPVVVAASDYGFQLMDAKLTYLWAVSGPAAFSQMGPLPIKIYARWISERVGRHFGLDPLGQLTVQIVAAYYYMSQFMGDDIEDARKHGIASILARTFGVQIDLVAKIIMPLGYLADAAALVDAMRLATGNPRLEKLNTGILYTMMAGSWYGANGRIIAAVALEYPPTFITMLYAAFSDRTYFSSYFAKTAISVDKKSQGREVVIAVDHLIRGV